MKTNQIYRQLFQDLRPKISALEVVNPLQGLARVMILGSICLFLTYQAWASLNLWSFILNTFIAGIVYAFLLVCTHDAIHHTLTGWSGFDEAIARVISYPILWAIGTYSELHFLHHGWNGINLNDPERVQLTVAEYQQIPFAKEFYLRYQWFVNIFIGGSFGLILKAFAQGWKHRDDRPNLRKQLITDIFGMITLHTILLTWVITHHLLWHYLLFYLIIERTVGVIVQTRDHLEHYGKWQQQGGQQATQLYATRNLKVHPLVSWLMGGLDYHAVHHAFPQIPFNKLASAHTIVQNYLQKYGLPLMEVEGGYIKTALKMSQQTSLIYSL